MRRVFVLVAAVGLMMTCSVSAHATTYAITDLGAIGRPRGINDLGQVVLQAGSQVYVWQNGVVQDLGTLPGSMQIGGVGSGRRGINNRGQMLGVDASSGSERAYLWENGAIQDLGTLPGCDRIIPYGLNDLGQVVGIAMSSVSSIPQYAFLWEDEVMRDLGTRPGSSWGSRAYDINNLGQIVVYDSLGGYLWQNGVIQEVNEVPPGFEYGQPLGINDLGQVVGCAVRAGAINSQGYIWQNGVAQDLGMLPGWELIQAWDINNMGQVLGYAYTSNPAIDPDWDGEEYRFLWQNGVIQEIGMALGTTRPLSVAAINNLGQLVGIDSTGRSVLWTPVPEPSSLLALLSGLAGIGGMALRRRRG